MNILSDEVLYHIFEYFDLNSAINISLSSKRFNNILVDELLWKFYFDRDLGIKHECLNDFAIKHSILKNFSNKEKYKICHDVNVLKQKCNKIESSIIDTIYLYKLNVEIFKVQKVMHMLFWNETIKIPKEIRSLINLRSLYAGDNNMTEIPKGILTLVNLQLLCLSYNKINKIPKDIALLVNLQKLDLSYNRISEIPNEFGSLVNLQVVDLSNNKMIRIPKEAKDNLLRHKCKIYY